MEGRGLAAIDVGTFDGADRIEQATRMALESQLLDIKDMSKAQGALVHVTGGNDVTLEEVTRAGKLVTRTLPHDVRIVCDARVNPEFRGKAQVMIVLRGVEGKFATLQLEAKPEPVKEKKGKFLSVFYIRPPIFEPCNNFISKSVITTRYA